MYLGMHLRDIISMKLIGRSGNYDGLRMAPYGCDARAYPALH